MWRRGKGHIQRGNHTQTRFTNNKYATVHRHVLDLSAWRARAVQCLCEHTGRGGVKLKAESWAECGAVACGRWRRRAATRHGHRHESTARDLGQEDAYSTFWSDTDRNRLTGHSRPRQSISKCAREIGRTGHRGQSVSKVKSLRTRHGRTGKSIMNQFVFEST